MAEAETRLIDLSIENSHWIRAFEFMMSEFRQDAQKGLYRPDRQVVGVGLDRRDLALNSTALTLLLNTNGIGCEFHPGLLREVKITRPVEQVGNVVYLNGAPSPELFVELIANDIPVPMDATLDAIAEHYNAGGSIFIVPAEIHWPFLRQ
jgi:hypothetical protein